MMSSDHEPDNTNGTDGYYHTELTENLLFVGVIPDTFTDHTEAR